MVDWVVCVCECGCVEWQVVYVGVVVVYVFCVVCEYFDVCEQVVVECDGLCDLQVCEVWYDCVGVLFCEIDQCVVQVVQQVVDVVDFVVQLQVDVGCDLVVV